MPKLNIGIITALALAGLATLVAIRHASQLKLREEIASLRRQAAQLPHLREEHQRLLNLVAQAAGAQPPSAGQLRELLGLRGETARLRQENRQLSAWLAAGQDPSSATPSPEPDTEVDRPRESWTFAGRATPDAALESYYWALTTGDLKTLQASQTSEAWQRMQTEWKEEPESQGKSEGDFAAAFSNAFTKLKGFHILKKDVLSENEVSLQVGFSGMAGATTHVFKKIEGEWKMGHEE